MGEKVVNELNIPIKVVEEILLKKETTLQPGEEMTQDPNTILKRIQPAS